jgi:hypothetical protein
VSSVTSITWFLELVCTRDATAALVACSKSRQTHVPRQVPTDVFEPPLATMYREAAIARVEADLGDLGVAALLGFCFGEASASPWGSSP